MILYHTKSYCYMYMYFVLVLVQTITWLSFGVTCSSGHRYTTTKHCRYRYLPSLHRHFRLPPSHCPPAVASPVSLATGGCEELSALSRQRWIASRLQRSRSGRHTVEGELQRTQRKNTPSAGQLLDMAPVIFGCHFSEGWTEHAFRPWAATADLEFCRRKPTIF